MSHKEAVELNYQVFSQEEIDLQSLHDLQILVYSRYSGSDLDKLPDQVPDISTNNKNSLYIVTQSQNTNRLFRPSGEINNNHLASIELLLSKQNKYLGFMKMTYASSEEIMHNQQVLEISQFYKIDELLIDRLMITEVSSFTINPLLSRESKIYIYQNMHKQLTNVAKEMGMEDSLFAIMTDPVAAFVISSGIGLETFPQFKLQRDNPRVQRVINQFPLYWDNNPRIRRFIID